MEVEKKSKVWEYIGWGSFILVGSFLFFCALILVFGDPKTKYQAQEVTAQGHEYILGSHQPNDIKPTLRHFLEGKKPIFPR
ncbi:hypothetical protein [Bacillus paranthracis]|uniref:hypothetical protein n=1 Tax=Bacillus paranthracis TaxID=2026186 RepID=UPI002E22C4F1|nr:hypothetical protein [Bacillus paranthracis]